MKHSQFHLLKLKRFAPAFLAQAFGAFNDNLFKQAMITLITYSGIIAFGLESEKLVTVAAGIFILPFFLFSALAGQLADKYDKTKLMRIIKVWEIILMILASVGFFMESAGFLLGVLFLMGAQSAFFGPIKYGILPNLLAEEELIGGNALVEAATFLAILAGIIAGTLLIRLDGGVWVVSIAIIAVAIMGALASFGVPPTKPGEPSLKINLNFAAEAFHIVGMARRDLVTFRSVIGISWFWLLGSVFLILLPVYARDVIGGNEQVLAFLLTIFTVGIGFGSLFCNKITKGQVSDIPVPFGALGMTAFGIDLYFASQGFTPDPTNLMGFATFISDPAGWRAMIDLLGIAGFGGIYIVPLYTMIQKRSRAEERARMIAANNILNALAMVIASGMIFALQSLAWTAPAIFLTVALINMPVAVYITHVVIGKLVNALLKRTRPLS